MVHNLRNYKVAKLLVKDLTYILRRVRELETSLTTYSKYRPVQKLLYTIKEQKGIIKHHLERQTRILEKKGETDEE